MVTLVLRLISTIKKASREQDSVEDVSGLATEQYLHTYSVLSRDHPSAMLSHALFEKVWRSQQQSIKNRSSYGKESLCTGYS